jgi:adenylate kinase family enzyme
MLLIGGKGGSGKSTLARQLGARCPIISVDRLLRPKRASNATVHDVQALIDSELKKDRSIKKMWNKLRDNDKVKDYLADAIARAVKQCQYSDTIIVEGYLVDDLAAGIEKRLGDQFKCWTLRPGV